MARPNYAAMIGRLKCIALAVNLTVEGDTIVLPFKPKWDIKDGLCFLDKAGRKLTTDVLRGVSEYDLPESIPGKEVVRAWIENNFQCAVPTPTPSKESES